MRNMIYLFMALPALTALFSSCVVEEAPEIRIIKLSETVEIPMANILEIDSGELRLGNPSALAYTPGADDELPQGPSSYDVLPDGSFVIGDPLQDRLVYYRATGAYDATVDLGFSPGRLRESEAAEKTLVERRASEAYILVNKLGEQELAGDGAAIMAATNGGTSRRIDDHHGTVSVAGRDKPIAVELDSDSLLLLSVVHLGTQNGRTFVLLETSDGGVPITVQRYLRIYDEKGRWSAMLEQVQEGHYIFPDDEFRIDSGRIYQMIPGRSSLKIYVWELEAGDKK